MCPVLLFPRRRRLTNTRGGSVAVASGRTRGRRRRINRLALGATILLMSLGIEAIGPAAIAGAANLGKGSAFCAAAVPGGMTLGDNFENVYACGPGVDDGMGSYVPSSGTNKGFFEDGSFSYQCTELANRVLYDIWKKSPINNLNVAGGGDLTGSIFADTVHSTYRTVPLFRNGTPGQPYLPGDIVSFSDGGAGHVAIVESDGPGALSGNGTITLLEENAPGSGEGETQAQVTDWVLGDPADTSIETPVDFDALAPLPAPTITNLTASPSTLSSAGGQVTLSANVTNATSCTFTSKPAIVGFNGAIACSTGPVSDVVIVPQNVSKKTKRYTFSLAVSGAKPVKASSVIVKGQPGYEAAVLKDHPISYWPLSDPAGTGRAEDLSGGDSGILSDGVTAGVPGPVTGQTAMQFDGGSCSGIDVSSGQTNLAPTQGLSVETWLKTSDVFPQVALRWRYDGYGLFGGATTDFAETTETAALNASIPIDNGQWHYVVATVNAKGTDLYIDGQLADATDTSALTYEDGGGAAIGRDGSACDGVLPSWLGDIGQVAIYGYALSSKQVRTHYAAA